MTALFAALLFMAGVGAGIGLSIWLFLRTIRDPEAAKGVIMSATAMMRERVKHGEHLHCLACGKELEP